MLYFVGDTYVFDNSTLLSTSLMYANNKSTTITTILPDTFGGLNQYKITNLVDGIYNLFFKYLDPLTEVVSTVQRDNFSVVPLVSEYLAFQYTLRTTLMAQMADVQQAILTQATDPSGMAVSKMDLTMLQRELSRVNTIIFHYNAAANNQSIIPL